MFWIMLTMGVSKTSGLPRTRSTSLDEAQGAAGPGGCLAIRVARKLKDIDVLSELFVPRGVPELVRSDKRSEFAAKSVQVRTVGLGEKTVYIAPGSRWENGYVESISARLREEFLDERSSAARGWRRYWSRVGDGITTPFGIMVRWATDRLRPRCSCPLSPLVRLGTPEQLRRPSYP